MNWYRMRLEYLYGLAVRRRDLIAIYNLTTRLKREMA